MFIKKIFNKRKTEFEWDEEKNRRNFQKHGVYFSTATKVFFDEKVIVRYDGYYRGEERYNLIGKKEKTLFVVFLEKKKNIIRIISARKATEREAKLYGKNREN